MDLSSELVFLPETVTSEKVGSGLEVRRRFLKNAVNCLIENLLPRGGGGISPAELSRNREATANTENQ